MEESRHIHYNDQLEAILQAEGERCMCWKWLHDKSQDQFNWANDWIAIPVIVLSTLAGTGSIGSEALFAGNTQAASIAIGGISLFVGILNTIANYYGFAKRAEAHKIAAMLYDKLARQIRIELSLPRAERCPAEVLLKNVREQCERLSETSPLIPRSVILLFKKQFGETTPNISKPEITNGLDPIEVFRGEVQATPKIAVDVGTDTGKPKINIKVAGQLEV